MSRRWKEMNKGEDKEGAVVHKPWGTLEELLLACAVNRHGVKSWDSIAMELQKRGSRTDHLRADVYSPLNCKRRYNDLRFRFSVVEGVDDDDDATMVDELKKLRVDELRREVERRDLSIELLELKVKRLEEEREQRKQEGKEEETNLPDELENRVPEENSRRERSVSGVENLSSKESNSTSNQKGQNRIEKGGKQRLKDGLEIKPGISDHEPVHRQSNPVQKCSFTNEEGTKPSGEAHSSTYKKRRRRSSSGEEEPNKLIHAKRIAIKSQPLIRILSMIRSHRNGSLFEHRLRSQETEKYNKMIRQHMDLQTVQCRMDRGKYLDSHGKFFRDLLLLVTNAIIYFPTTSNHHIAALELRNFVTEQMATGTTNLLPPKPDPVHLVTDTPFPKLRQSGNNPVLSKFDPGKKLPVSVPARPCKVGAKLDRPEAKPHSDRVWKSNKGSEEDKSTKKQLVKDMPQLSSNSGRTGSGYSGKERQKSPPMEVEEDSSDEDACGGETKKPKKMKENGRNNGRGKRARALRKSLAGRDVGRGKKGDELPPPWLDVGRPRKRSKK